MDFFIIVTKYELLISTAQQHSILNCTQYSLPLHLPGDLQYYCTCMNVIIPNRGTSYRDIKQEVIHLYWLLVQPDLCQCKLCVRSCICKPNYLDLSSSFMPSQTLSNHLSDHTFTTLADLIISCVVECVLVNPDGLQLAEIDHLRQCRVRVSHFCMLALYYLFCMYMDIQWVASIFTLYSWPLAAHLESPMVHE